MIVDKPNIDPSALEVKVLPKTSNKYWNLQRRLVSEAKNKQWRENYLQNPQKHQHHHQHHHSLPNPPQPKPGGERQGRGIK